VKNGQLSGTKRCNRAMEDGVEAGERRAARRAAGRKTGTARSVLYLMRQRTLAAAAPASAGDGGRPTQRKQAPQRTRSRAVCARTSAKGAGARSAGARASASTSAKGAHARSAGARASASTSASGASARSAARRRTRRCRPAWRSSRGQRMLLVKTCDLSHGPHVTVAKQS
jgi:hypothetical protein